VVIIDSVREFRLILEPLNSEQQCHLGGMLIASPTPFGSHAPPIQLGLLAAMTV
jgi:hypothetical protein